MKYKLNIFVALFLIVLLAGVVFADSDNDTNEKRDSEKENVMTVKNFTFGQCVSENAKLKNVCFKSSKDVLKTCKTDSKANSADRKAKKNTVKLCEQTYKEGLVQCKFTFKESKNECEKIRHGFFEGLKYSFD